MAGTKRAAEDSGPATRSSKVPKTDAGATPKPKSKGGRKGPKTHLAASAFKARALPLHVNVTHTPPSIPDADTVPSAPTDPGFVTSTTLVPSSFATGSYGWKGSRRVTIELDNPEGGEKEKVTVMLSINATVLGSKDAKEEEEAKDEAEGAEVAPTEDAAVVAAEKAGEEAVVAPE